MIVGDGYRLNLDPRTQLSDRCENRGSLSAVGHSVGRILHITTGKDFAIRQQDGCAYVEVRVGSMRVLHHPDCRLLQFFPHTGRDCLFGHRDKVIDMSWFTSKTPNRAAIVNPCRWLLRFSYAPLASIGWRGAIEFALEDCPAVQLQTFSKTVKGSYDVG